MPTSYHNHKCPQCSRSFTRAFTLKNHLNVHAGVKPYSCSVCAEKFTRKHDRNIHEREKHEDTELYFCRRQHEDGSWHGCQKGFKRKRDLQRHLSGKRDGRCRGLLDARSIPTASWPSNAHSIDVLHSAITKRFPVARTLELETERNMRQGHTGMETVILSSQPDSVSLYDWKLVAFRGTVRVDKLFVRMNKALMSDLSVHDVDNVQELRLSMVRYGFEPTCLAEYQNLLDIAHHLCRYQHLEALFICAWSLYMLERLLCRGSQADWHRNILLHLLGRLNEVGENDKKLVWDKCSEIRGIWQGHLNFTYVFFILRQFCEAYYSGSSLYDYEYHNQV